MGMFDYLRINPDLLPASAEEKLLLKSACEGNFQTKSLHSILTVVEITDNGKLRWEDTNYEEVPKEQRSYPDAGEESLLSLFGSIKRTNHRWVDEPDFTGKIRFYEYINSISYEFCALFAEGELLKIVKVSPK